MSDLFTKIYKHLRYVLLITGAHRMIQQACPSISDSTSGTDSQHISTLALPCENVSPHVVYLC